MEAEQRRAAKEQMIALMQTGHRWQEAAAQAGIQVSRSTCAGYLEYPFQKRALMIALPVLFCNLRIR